MLKEFKEFIAQGNALDLAVGVIIGGAFSAIVTALVENLLMPLISMVIGNNFATLAVTVNGVEFVYGALIQAVVNFIFIAFVLFMILKAVNKVKKPEVVVEEVVATPEDTQLLREIRDSLKK